MFDKAHIERAKSVDLLHLIGDDSRLRRVASTGGGEYAGPCPFCGGRDRFRVQPHAAGCGRWFCRGCTEGKWQDVIAYVMQRDHIDFPAACRFLAGDDLSVQMNRQRRIPRRSPVQITEKKEGFRSPMWQRKAKSFIAASEKNLWSAQGKEKRAWLHARGLTDETLRHWRIGYHPQQRFESLAAWNCENNEPSQSKMWLASGITIPCIIDGLIRYVKIRRFEGKQKYVQLKGGAPALFGGSTLSGRKTGVLVEGEFDAMLLHQEGNDLAGVATLGGAGNKKIDLAEWSHFLLPVHRFFIAYDLDDAGKSGANRLDAMSARMRRISIPHLRENDKDLTDYYVSGGNLRDWLRFEIERGKVVEKPEDEAVSVQNPTSLFDPIFEEITARIQEHERKTRCTWAEIMTAVKIADPELLQAYRDAYAAADCDIYGRWLRKAVTPQDLQRFQDDLQKWRQAVDEVLIRHKELYSQENPELQEHHSEAHKTNTSERPAKCHWCKSTDFWRKPCGHWVCANCHPAPNKSNSNNKQ